MTLDASKITNSAFILHDVLSDQEKHVLLKTLIKVFTPGVNVLNIFVYNRFTFSSIPPKTYLCFYFLRLN